MILEEFKKWIDQMMTSLEVQSLACQDGPTSIRILTEYNTLKQVRQKIEDLERETPTK